MHEHQVDYTLFFRRLGAAIEAGTGDEPVRSLFVGPAAAAPLLQTWGTRLDEEPTPLAGRRAAMDAVNPASIPRNRRIEAVSRAAEGRSDFGAFEELLTVLARPFEEQPEIAAYAAPPEEFERVRATFCGT